MYYFLKNSYIFINKKIKLMELLLWLWFYDPRWFFNFKISISLYLWTWIIPFFIHIFLSASSFYFIKTECEASLRLWLFSRGFSSFLLAANILFFMIKIVKVNRKESSFFENAKKIYPALKDNVTRFDFWIRRKSLISTPGIILLFLGGISLFWSYVMFNLYFIDNKFNNCDENILTILNINTIIILIGNIPLIVVLLCLILFKITSYLAAYLCPNCLISVSKCFTPNIVKLQYNKSIDT